MINLLNSPLETGIRVLSVLAAAFPASLDVSRLVLLDHGLLYSALLGGPENLHPSLSSPAGELGIKRQQIEDGLQILIRSDLATIVPTQSGIQFQATESASSFLSLLESEYASKLQQNAAWTVSHLDLVDEDSLRGQMNVVLHDWSEEFALQPTQPPLSEG